MGVGAAMVAVPFKTGEFVWSGLKIDVYWRLCPPTAWLAGIGRKTMPKII